MESGRIREVEHGSFTPLVFSTCGGMGQEASVVIKKLADDLARKRNECYSCVVGWMRCCLTFLLVRAAVRCMRGSCSTRWSFHHQTPNDLVQAEAQMDLA